MMSDALVAKLFWEQTQEADIRIRKDEKLSSISKFLYNLDPKYTEKVVDLFSKKSIHLHV